MEWTEGPDMSEHDCPLPPDSTSLFDVIFFTSGRCIFKSVCLSAISL